MHCATESRDRYYMPLPVWIGGNVFSNGAKPCDIEERFEAPDGSDIVFDTDYYGKKRTATTVAGPFAS